MVGAPPLTLTNAIIRRCTVAGVNSYFRYSHAFTASQVENCLVSDCQGAVYFEPNPAWGDNNGPVLIRSNLFLHVDYGIALVFSSAAHVDSLTCLNNEMVLTGAGGWGFYG